MHGYYTRHEGMSTEQLYLRWLVHKNANYRDRMSEGGAVDLRKEFS